MHILESNSTNIQVQSYVPGASFKIQGIDYSHSILLTPQTCTPWTADTIVTLSAAHIAEIIAYKPTLVLIGTGRLHHFLDPELLAPLMAHHIGFEVMSTAAACRTFTLIAGDNRPILAALCLS